MASIPRRDLIHLGMDVHKDSISIATLRPDDSMDVEKIFHDEALGAPIPPPVPRPEVAVDVLRGGSDRLRAAPADRGHGDPLRRGGSLAHPEGSRGSSEDRPPRRPQLARLHRAGELTLASEVCDWARFPRASAFMGFAGLGVTEYSTGGKTRRGHITKTGSTHLRTQLVEAAWSYQHGPSVGPTLRRRQEACTPDTVARSWAAQRRLCARFRTLAARKNVKSVVAAAVARELGGFLWEEMTA